MTREHLRQLTAEERERGQRARTVRKAQASRLNAVRTGKRIQAAENKDKPLALIQLEKTLRTAGEVNATEMAQRVMQSLSLVETELAHQVNFPNTVVYSRLVCEIYKAIKPESAQTSVEHEERMREYECHFQATRDVVQAKNPALMKDISLRFLELKNKAATTHQDGK